MSNISFNNYRNEQEFLLLEEKHREEMELCKIRLGNATKIIAQLEQELSVYRAKRYNFTLKKSFMIKTKKINLCF